MDPPYSIFVLLRPGSEGSSPPAGVRNTLIGVGLSRILDMDFRESPFPRTRVNSSPRMRNPSVGAIMRGVGEWSYWDQPSPLAQLGITEQPELFLSPEDF